MLVLSMGDPAGIGGEIAGKAWTALRESGPGFVMVGDPGGMGVPVRVVGSVAEGRQVFGEALPVLALTLEVAVVPGRPDTGNARAVIASIERAVRLVQAGEARAVVTNPIAKCVLYGAGFAFPGHTEFLGALTGCARPVMMLVNRYLRVVPVTVHVGLLQAIGALTMETIVETGRIVDAALRAHFAVLAPRLAVCGLNPHAGEGGAMGDEEARIIQPAIEAMRAAGVDARGPYPPDTAFTPDARAGYDAVLCMYHDQALIPLKTLDMASGVNVTLGLPIVRTSPDHGTAFDIAGHGRADPSSLIAALRLAQEMSA